MSAIHLVNIKNILRALVGRRVFALVLVIVASPLAFASPQPATLSFSYPGLSGSFGVKIESTTQTLISINSVALTIDGYRFKTKDIGFRYDAANNITFIAGLPNGIDVVQGGPPADFFLVWTPSSNGGYISFVSYTAGAAVIPGTPVELKITPRKEK
jgi:hypothetical protein